MLLLRKFWSLDSEFEKAYYVDDSSFNIKAKWKSPYLSIYLHNLKHILGLNLRS